MEAHNDASDIEALLAQRDFVRGLARRLLADEQGAEDLAQSALAAVLSRPGAGHIAAAGGVRAYLAGVLRHLAGKERRGAARRAEREQQAARHEATSSTDAIVAREEWRRRVVEAVLELEPRQREVILLRFFEGLPPRRIAQTLGLPVETVKTRQKRGLASLRPRLAAGRERRELFEGLTLLALPAPGVARLLPLIGPGAAVMSHASKIAVAALVVLCTGVAYRVASAPEPVPGDAAAELALVPSGARQTAPVLTPLEHDEGERVALIDPADAAEPAGAISLDATTHIFRGRVLDSARFAVGNANIELLVPGVSPLHAVSDDDGHFELSARLPAENRGIHLLAHDGSGAAGRLQVTVPDRAPFERTEVELQPLVLRPAHALHVQVLDGNGLGREARLRIELGHSRALSFERETGAAGEVELAHLPAGPVHLTAAVPGREGRALTFVPEHRSALVELVSLGESQVEVVDATSRRGISGVVLEVREQVAVPAVLPGEDDQGFRGERTLEPRLGMFITDADGRARIVAMLRGTEYLVHASSPDHVPFPGPGAAAPRIRAGDPPLVVELEPRRSLRWPIVPGEVGVPPDGASIELRLAPGMGRHAEAALPLAPARMEGSMLVASRIPPHVELLAQAPDKSLAHLVQPSDGELGPQASFRSPRRIEVLVRNTAGEPVEGALVKAQDAWWNDLCPPSRTKGGGVALLEGLHGGIVDIQVAHPGLDSALRTRGRVDVDAGDGRLEVMLPGWLSAVLAIRIDGEPRLPGQYRLHAYGMPCPVVREDPELGELVLEVEGASPGASSRVYLVALGFPIATIDLEFPADGSPARAEVVLERASVLVAHLRGRSDEPHRILPQRFDAATQEWSDELLLVGHVDGHRHPNGPGGSYVFQGATPGRWRVLETTSRTPSSEVVLAPGQKEAHVELELGTAHWVSGRVELEDPGELARVRVLVEGLEAKKPWASASPGTFAPEGIETSDGTFRLRVPGDRPVRIVPWHPWLVPAEDGTVELREGRDGILLRLVAGDELRLEAPQLAGSRLGSLRLARFPDKPGIETSGPPLAFHHAPPVGGIFRCSLPRGRWTLWIDPGVDFAPLVLRGVLVDGVTELRTTAFQSGSALRIRYLLPENLMPPGAFLHARLQGEGLAYSRFLFAEGENELQLAGLGPGRYTVRLDYVGFRSPPYENELVLDGHSDHTIELDLR